MIRTIILRKMRFTMLFHDSNLGLVGISYTYVANTSTTATLTLARNEPGDVIHQISFSSPTSADSNWTDVE